MLDRFKNTAAWDERKSLHKKITIALWGILALGVVGVILMFFWLSKQDLPTFQQLENPEINVATEVLAVDGTVLGKYYRENRIMVDYDEISPKMINALIATEDERFHDHAGIDGEALARVLVKTILGFNKDTGGGSTISQQLAKILFGRPKLEGNIISKVTTFFFQKLKEWIVSVRLEKSYTKEEIIAMYLNEFEFIHGAHGINTASKIYFNTTPDKLTQEDAAMLVGMLKNPAYFNPISAPDRSTLRREVVLKQMVIADYLTKASYDSLRVLPLNVSEFQTDNHSDGLAPYFRSELAKDVKNILRKLSTDDKKYDIYGDGLKIYTTIDPGLQAHAEAAAAQHMAKLQKQFDTHWKKLNPLTWNVDAKSLKARKRVVENKLRQTKRYQALRAKHFSPYLVELKKELKLENDIRDVDLDRLERISKKESLLKKWESTGFIKSSQAKDYKTLLSSDGYNKIKVKQIKLEKIVQEEMSKKVPMKVFAYNKAYEKDTVMSPLDSIDYMGRFLQTGILALDSRNGDVKAWVGGINHKYFKFDHVHKASGRQVGSTFKPFVYATAIQNKGLSPCYKIMDSEQIFEKEIWSLSTDWMPKNATGKFTDEPMTLMEGLRTSTNSVSAGLVVELGPNNLDEIRNLARDMGIDTDTKMSNGEFRLPARPSICLGTADLSVIEMTGAYTTFANGGNYSKPRYLLRIEDKNGNTLYTQSTMNRNCIDEASNYAMVQLLKNAKGFVGGVKSEVGGKTGTTNKHTDGWFMGITPELTVGTWVGGDNAWIRFRTLNYGQGSHMAKPIFRYFLTRVENDPTVDYDESARFKIPRNITIQTDCSLYEQMNQNGGEMVNDSIPMVEEDNPFEDIDDY